MAGSLNHGPDSHNPNKVKQGAPNLTGHTYRCAACLQVCPPFLPDNVTLIPVCQSCWKQIGITNRLMIVTFTRNTKAVESLTLMIQEYLGQRGIMVGKFRPGEGN